MFSTKECPAGTLHEPHLQSVDKLDKRDIPNREKRNIKRKKKIDHNQLRNVDEIYIKAAMPRLLSILILILRSPSEPYLARRHLQVATGCFFFPLLITLPYSKQIFSNSNSLNSPYLVGFSGRLLKLMPEIPASSHSQAFRDF